MVLEVSVEVATRNGLEGDSVTLETFLYLVCILLCENALMCTLQVCCMLYFNNIHIKISCKNM